MRTASSGSKKGCAVVPDDLPIRLVVVPTAGVSRKNPWVPDRAGRRRLEAARNVLRRYPEARLVVTGGYPNQDGITLALIYALFIFPEVGKRGRDSLEWSRLVCVEGRANNTFDDVLLALADVGAKRGDEVAFCTNRRHYRRLEPAVKHLGIVPWLALSKEPDRWSLTETVLRSLVLRDPALSGKWMKLVGWVATNHSAKRHLRRFKKWERAHPDAYAEGRGDIARLRVEMRRDEILEFPRPVFPKPLLSRPRSG